ncbi:hypothetical protein H5410_047980 [Solanum commersonii]|uniref:NB-ARC domain-containing protein n=1 Tax=Solanum commersonii TaxID=4109 RepID=A0A9J5XIN4_SOLCO|nr:hypothetical protein H5410_047980 [Solanum commersonii]
MADILPECLIQKILCFLSYTEATRMRILSKTWLQAWSTLPNLDFTINCWEGNTMSDYSQLVDTIMERYRKGKIPIERFELLENINDSHKDFYFPLIDKWLDIALQNGVKDLFLEFTSYPTPILTILAGKSLRELVLCYCTLMPVSLSSGVVNCNSLKKISLSHVTLDENTFDTLFNSCPLIVSFILEYCSGMTLRKIKSDSLKVLKIHHLYGIEEIDAPNLVSLDYMGNQIPELKMARESSQLEHSKITLLCRSSNAAWFCKLKKLLSNSSSSSKVTLQFFNCTEISMTDLQMDHIGSIPRLDVLDVYCLDQTMECPTFVDALLWSCHPRKLKLVSNIIGTITHFIDRLPLQLRNLHDEPIKSTSSSFVEVKVGHEGDKAGMIDQHLDEHESELDVISIVGMPGLGKTTLANKVYNNTLVAGDHFNVPAWCIISQKYNKSKVLREILQQVTGSEGIESEDDCVKSYKEHYSIKGDMLIACFPKVKRGNRIILTSRSSQVGLQIKCRSDPLDLQLLTPEKKATRMSILSKTWLQEWFTLPNLEFTINCWEGNINTINTTMERYRKENIPIQKFELLELFANSHEDFPLIDKWLDVALQNGVKDLYLNFTSYPVPILTILAAKTLRELVLRGSTLMSVSLSSSVVNCNSLRKLSLSHLSLDCLFHPYVLFRKSSKDQVGFLEGLENSSSFRDREIDAPNLVSLDYMGNQIPELKIARESTQLSTQKSMLRKFLSNLSSWSQVTLYFINCGEINMTDLQMDHIGSTPHVDILNVNILWKNQTMECPTYVDALLWSCHPKRLNLHSNIKTITRFINRLMYMKSLSHSTSHGSTLWHCQLKEIKAFDGENQSLQLRSWELAKRIVMEGKEKVHFLLDW